MLKSGEPWEYKRTQTGEVSGGRVCHVEMADQSASEDKSWVDAEGVQTLVPELPSQRYGHQHVGRLGLAVCRPRLVRLAILPSVSHGSGLLEQVENLPRR